MIGGTEKGSGIPGVAAVPDGGIDVRGASLRRPYEELHAENQRLREALRRAYPYVRDALYAAEENTPATAYIVREDLEQAIVPALRGDAA